LFFFFFFFLQAIFDIGHFLCFGCDLVSAMMREEIRELW